ncbi:MAG: hypothetical protein ACXWNQ_04030 [Anaerolineales bacterium]
MNKRRAAVQNAAILGIILVGGLIRVFAYGDLRLSIGNGETRSYISSSISPLFSWQSFAGKRLFTTNLIYKLANNLRVCKLMAISYPAGGLQVAPALQPCFGNIALLQNLLGIFGWCYLAWVTSRWLIHFPARVGVVLLILFFGFTPQIAEWDTILSPESFSLTLFIILIALLQDIVFRFLRLGSLSDRRRNNMLIGVWLLTFALWVLIRDVHLYAIPVTLGLIAVLLFSKDVRHAKAVPAAMGILAALFVLGYTSAQASMRATHYPLVHSFEDYILPFPARVAFFQRFGMPDATAPGYQHWLDQNGTRTYTAFLISHPGFVVSTLWANLYDFRAEFTQPYFKPADKANRAGILLLAEIIHPETLAVYLVDVLCIIALFVGGWTGRRTALLGWAWLGAWVFACSAITLLASFFGDANGFRRHLLPSVEPFRLLMWLLLLACLDALLTRPFSPVHEIAPALSSATGPTAAGNEESVS